MQAIVLCSLAIITKRFVSESANSLFFVSSLQAVSMAVTFYRALMYFEEELSKAQRRKFGDDLIGWDEELTTSGGNDLKIYHSDAFEEHHGEAAEAQWRQAELVQKFDSQFHIYSASSQSSEEWR